MKTGSIPARVWAFYRDGFRSMTVGRTLWILIGIKLVIMFAVLKLFFFQGFLKQHDDEGRDNYVRRQLIERTDNSQRESESQSKSDNGSDITPEEIANHKNN